MNEYTPAKHFSRSIGDWERLDGETNDVQPSDPGEREMVLRMGTAERSERGRGDFRIETVGK